jgi:group I intron endonuclease
MIGIYKITNPKGRVYIGQSVNIEKRKKEYSSQINCKTQPKLYRSLIKYSFCDHIFEVVEECKIEELNVKERYWQEYYNVLEEGLNCRLTGAEGKSGKMSKHSIQKMSQSSGKPVTQYTVEGVLIKEWSSSKEAGYVLNIHYENISACCRQKIKSAGGFIWRFRRALPEEQILVGKIGYESTSEKLKKPVVQYDRNGKYVREWECLTEVTTTLNIRQGDISNCIKGRQKTAKGFIWKYKK